MIIDPGSAYYDDFRGGFAPSEVIIKCRSRIKDQEAMAVAVAVKKFNTNDLSYTRTLIFTPNYLTLGCVTRAHDYIPRGSKAPSDVIVVCRSRIHDQMAVSVAVAVAVDCALRLRTFAQKFLT